MKPLSIGFARRAALFVPLLALGLAARTTPVAADPSGTWAIEHHSSRGEVQLTLRHEEGGSRHVNSHGVLLRHLEGLDPRALEGRAGDVRFELRRDAGTFRFAGRAGDGRGRGTWEFEADPEFPSRLARRGYERPTGDETFRLAMADVGFALIDELDKQDYSRPSTRTLVQMGQHGVNLDYLRRMGALGYRVGDAETLIRMRDHGVDPPYVEGMARHGFRKVSADELVTARDHGVDPDYLEGFGAEIANLDLAEIVRMRDHGVDGTFAAGFRELGYRTVSASALVTLRDHGVDPRFARELNQVIPDLSLDELRRARDHGVDAGYARRVKSRVRGTVTIDDVIHLRDRGVDL
jgi:hypothetical protein